jgi:hypothetical protein
MSDPQPTPQKKRGCLFYGCLSVAAIVLLAGVLIGVGAYKFVTTVNAAILEYTDTAPAALPTNSLSVDQLRLVQDRVNAFDAAINGHSNTPPLTLTTQEVNALIADSQQIKDLKLKDRFYVSFDGDQIKAQISMPLEQLKVRFIKTDGRYLNGDATVAGMLTNSEVTASIVSMNAKGKPLPDQFVAILQGFDENVISNINNNPTNRAVFDGIDSAQVKDGVLVIKAKQH